MLTSDWKVIIFASSFDFPRWSCELPNVQTWQLCSCERERKCAVIIEEYFSCWKHNVMNVTVVGVQMDHSCSRVLKILFYFSVSLHSCFNLLLLLNTSIEGNEKKTALEQICKWSVVLWKIPLRTPPSKQLHFRQAKLNLNKDFVVTVLDSSRARQERLKTRLASKANIG